MLAGCAWVAGPCELDGAQRRVGCDAGGWMILWRPAETIRAARERDEAGALRR